MSEVNVLGIIFLIIFVLCGRKLMSLFPPKGSKDWLKIALLSAIVIGSMLPLIFWNFQAS